MVVGSKHTRTGVTEDLKVHVSVERRAVPTGVFVMHAGKSGIGKDHC
jgi:hypothetical protein